jgi:hypothetical protein
MPAKASMGSLSDLEPQDETTKAYHADVEAYPKGCAALNRVEQINFVKRIMRLMLIGFWRSREGPTCPDFEARN